MSCERCLLEVFALISRDGDRTLVLSPDEPSIITLAEPGGWIPWRRRNFLTEWGNERQTAFRTNPERKQRVQTRIRRWLLPITA